MWIVDSCQPGLLVLPLLRLGETTAANAAHINKTTNYYTRRRNMCICIQGTNTQYAKEVQVSKDQHRCIPDLICLGGGDAFSAFSTLKQHD